VINEDVSFYSEGVPMGGVLRFPDDWDKTTPLPLIIQPPGWLGIADGPHYLPWQEAFLGAGFAVLVFDYRGFGRSGGDRGWVRPDWQVEDVLSAVTYATTRADIDPLRIGAFGMGATGGGHAIMAAALDDTIRCVVAQTVIADGADWLHRMRREHEWVDLQARIREDRKRWVLEGTGASVRPRTDLIVDPPERNLHNPRRAIDAQLAPQEFFLRNADLTMRYKPLDYVHRIAPRAVMVVAIKNDVFTFEDHALALYAQAGEPKKLLRQTRTTHWEAYVDNFAGIATEMVDWFERYLVAEPAIVTTEATG
jgi:dipeptidyl aminopeptidase/acylaminoacyl peptidase